MSKNPLHIKENWDIFDFKLSKTEGQQIDRLKKKLLFTSDFDKALRGCERHKVSLYD